MAANTHSLSLTAASSMYAWAADSTSLSVTGNMSGACWVRFASVIDANANTLFAKYDRDTPVYSYLFELTRSGATYTLQLHISSDGTSDTVRGVTWTPNLSQWYHLAFVYNAAGGTVAFYVDAVQQGTTQSGLPTSINDSVKRFSVGSVTPTPGTPSFFLDGLIDEVVVTSGNFTTTEISKLQQGYDAGPLLGNLSAYYKLNNDYLDSSGNTNTLTAVNSPTFSTTVPFANYFSVANNDDYSYFL